jgi:MFS family permease
MDLAFEALNSTGRFQKILSVIIVMVAAITLFLSIGLPFFSKIPQMKCRDKETDQFPFMPCSEHDYCKDNIYEYEIDYKNSLHNIALEFNLYCSKGYYLAIIGTAFFLGGTIGSLALSPIPDQYGRAGIYKILAVVSCICQLNFFFSIGPLHIAITAFIAGMVAYSYSMSMLLITEFLDRNTSGMVMSINNAIFPAVGILISLFFLFINSWRLLFLITFFFSCLITYLTFKYFVESPRWLNSKNRIVDCIDKLKAIAEINGTLENLNKFLEQNKTLINHSVSNLKEEKQTMNIIQILMCKSVRVKVLCLLFIWLSSGACFYGLILNIEHLGGNMFVDSILTFSAELFAEMISGWFADIYGRKIVLQGGCFVGGIAFILFELISTPSIKTVLLFITSLGFSTVFNVIYIYSPEAIPTSIRSTVMGVLFVSSRIGAMSVPTILRIVNHPPILFGILSLISGYLCKFMEETLGAELQDDIVENTKPEAQQSFFTSSRRLLGSKGEKLRRTIVSDTYFTQTSDKFNFKKVNVSSNKLK